MKSADVSEILKIFEIFYKNVQNFEKQKKHDAAIPGDSSLRILPWGWFVIVQFVASNHETRGIISKL